MSKVILENFCKVTPYSLKVLDRYGTIENVQSFFLVMFIPKREIILKQ